MDIINYQTGERITLEEYKKLSKIKQSELLTLISAHKRHVAKVENAMKEHIRQTTGQGINGLDEEAFHGNHRVTMRARKWLNKKKMTEEDRITYEDAVYDQIERTIEQKGEGNLDQLLYSGDTWSVGDHPYCSIALRNLDWRHAPVVEDGE